MTSQYTIKPTIYYIKQNEQLKRQVEQLQAIVSSLTAVDDLPLPFTAENGDCSFAENGDLR